MAPSEHDRSAYLGGEDGPALTAAERAELDEVRALLRSPATWAEPDPGLEQSVVDAIESEAGRHAQAEAPAAPRRRRARREPRRTGRPSWRPIPALAGLAAAAAVVAALVVGLTSGGGSKPPVQYAMVVSGTRLAPLAGGDATLTKTDSGWRIELSANGLPRLANGRYYEAWLKNAAGVLVPVGTFNDARKVTLWAGVPPTAFPSLTVTRQRVGADQRSSGERVLTGTIRARR
jgi:hypothetical protein